MKRYNLNIVCVLMLLMIVSSCTEQLDFFGKKRQITVNATISENETRAYVYQESGSLNLIAKWEELETINLIVIQDGMSYKTTSEPISNITNDGKKCAFTFNLPGAIDPDRPYDVFGLCWIDGDAIAEEGKAYAKSTMRRGPFNETEGVAPMWFHTKTSGSESFMAYFKHLGTYEVLHVKNETGESLSFNHKGFDVQNPWFKYEELTMLDDDYDPTQYVTEPGDVESGNVYIAPRSTGAVLSWYIPNGLLITDARLMASINGRDVVSSNSLSSSVKIQRGHAYHMYATWDGTELKFDKVNDLLDELGLGFKHLELEEDSGYGFITGREGHLSFNTTDPSVATAIETDDIGDPHVDILSHSIGTAIITITDTNTGEKSQVEVVVTERINYAVLVEVGETECVTMKNENGHFEAYSEDVSLATCEVSGNKIYVTGVKNGETTIHVTETGTGKQYTITVKVYGGIPDIPVETETFTVNGVTFKMIAVEGGTFWMGASDDDSEADNDEKPRHQVTLSDYCIGQTEVTQALWETVMGELPSYINDYGDELPVNWISWDDCQEFISKLNNLTGRSFRMPTEAEWEYAARGGKYSHGYIFAGSNDIDEVGWYRDNAHPHKHPVGQKKPNELGLYDMSGNVSELCEDWYYHDYYSISPIVNPCNQTKPNGVNYTINHEYRGGNTYYSAKGCRVTSRAIPVYKSGDIGLRLALSDGGATPVSYKNCPDDNHPHMIDLGLPSGTLWACCNVGASKPEDYGGYYAWGETHTKDIYDWSTYIHCADGTFQTCLDIGSDIAGTEYDAATANWGAPWRMPSLTQYQELYNNCSSAWTTQNGVNGRKFIGSNGGMIFLPAAGSWVGSGVGSEGWSGDYWSSVLGNEQTEAYAFYFGSGSDVVGWGSYLRYNGLSARPVRNSNSTGSTSVTESDELKKSPSLRVSH